ncbi:PPK2 family polyphosphate kinase [Ruicaihuangia caeni]|uniref:Polyphosphate kinase 2 family protein n=1 Tax=Ruicaihuangia caeni TaxID=3042517 RepID=A0AAW6T728_9MICO|nr:PPK2 family polyphosphate kinase [Klugiella sp. YN-L-19]MDI2098896.1 polyphosphate kinase 2 family protein [Klugiella sp. YN-L-19]
MSDAARIRGDHLPHDRAGAGTGASTGPADPATSAFSGLFRAPLPLDLASIDPRATPGFTGEREDADAAMRATDDELSDLQERLFAGSRTGDTRRVLLVLQAMDTAGKGGILRHVIGAVDPQGVRITAFKAPTEEERQHDFLWRVRRALPPAGMIGVFDRSHYEDVLVQRVRGLSRPDEVERRYEQIVEFEQELTEAGVSLIKVMLHISKAEQKERLRERLDRPDKHWKFDPGDIDERAYWNDYMRAYELAIDRTNTAAAPWYVVPADRKWFAPYAVHGLLLETLRGLQLQWPLAEFDVASERRRLEAS